MNEGSTILIALLVVFASGKLAGELFERIKQPAVIGELLAGIVIGPGLMGWVHPSETLTTVATMGVTVLMFSVGLETRPTSLFRVGARAIVVAAGGIVVPLAAGFWFGTALGLGAPESIFIGTALVATSVGVTARVLADCGFLSTLEARIVLAAAIVDDVLGMLVLSFATGAAHGGVDVTRLSIVAIQVVVFLVFELWIAPIVVKRHGDWLDRLKMPNAGFVVALTVMLAMAALSEAIGLAGIIGAFFAGMMFAETEGRWELSRQSRPLYEWLVPYFFIVTGMQVQLSVFRSAGVLIPGLALVLVAVATKVIGCGLGGWGLGWKRMAVIGVGMVPRGEIGLIIASAGLSMGALGDTTYAMIVLVVILTTVVAPPLLALVFPWATGAVAHPVDLDSDEVIA